MNTAPRRTSIEGVVLGRNDDYEPGWTDRLRGSLRYNHELFAARGVDYRVAFVEWNPPPGRPLLAPGLTKEFPFVRAIIIDAAVHDALCTADDLTMMLNFAYNPALRTSTADYCLITSGDLFFGRALADRIAARGLAPGCLYRAERVNIREELGGVAPDASVIEAAENIVSVNTCSEPPYDKPPYTHAAGDFLLVDRVTMAGLRGFDESIRFARLHLDSRFCVTAMHADLGCELLGRVYHINHRNSYVNRVDDYPGRHYSYEANLPYLNPPDWGLARMAWTREDDRTWHISLPPAESVDLMPSALTHAEITRADEITRRLALRRERLHPDHASTDLPVRSKELDLQGFRVRAEWAGATAEPGPGTLLVTTVGVPWGYSASMRLPEESTSDQEWTWLHLRALVTNGSVGIGVLQHDRMLHERFCSVHDGVTDIWLPVPHGDGLSLMLRNGGEARPSQLCLESVRLVSQQKASLPFEQLLLAAQPQSSVIDR